MLRIPSIRVSQRRRDGAKDQQEIVDRTSSIMRMVVVAKLDYTNLDSMYDMVSEMDIMVPLQVSGS